MVNSMDGDAVAPNRRLEGTLFKWRPSFPVLARRFLKTAMWLVFLEWVIMIFLYPSPSLVGTFLRWFYATDTSFYGLVASFLWMFGAHVLILAIPAAIYAMAFPMEYQKTKKSRFFRFRLSTFPALVSGPFGVVSASELIGILIFAAFIVWACYGYTIQNHRTTSTLLVSSSERRNYLRDISVGFKGRITFKEQSQIKDTQQF